MKIILNIFFFCMLGISTVKAQKPRQIINDRDSTLELYLNNRIEKIANLYTDTCIEGFYAIAFSLSKKGEVNQFTVSKKLPPKYADTLKALVTSLKPLWTKDFIRTVNKSNTVIVQPFYLSILENCTSNMKIRYQPQGDTSALSALKESSDFWEAALKDKLKVIAGFPMIFDLTDESIDLHSCYILPPATIIRYAKRNRHTIDSN